MTTLPFGKYRGVDLEHIPTAYLAWAVDHVPIDVDLAGAITRELLHRNIRDMIKLFETCPAAIDRMRDVLQDFFRALDRYGFESDSLAQLKSIIRQSALTALEDRIEDLDQELTRKRRRTGRFDLDPAPVAEPGKLTWQTPHKI